MKKPRSRERGFFFVRNGSGLQPQVLGQTQGWIAAGSVAQRLGHTQGWNWATVSVAQRLGHTQVWNWAVVAAGVWVIIVAIRRSWIMYTV